MRIGLLLLIVALMGVCVGKGIAQSAVMIPVESVQAKTDHFPDREELLRRIGVCEEDREHALSAHADNVTIAKVDLLLGSLYGDAGMYPQAEVAVRRAITLLQNGPYDQLAEAMDHLAILLAAMGQDEKSEKEDMAALAIHEKVGDPGGIAIAWSDLAGIEIKHRQFSKAAEHAQKAVDLLKTESAADAGRRIAAKQALGYALAGMGRCEGAISALQSAVALSANTYGQDSMAVAINRYLLGHSAWQCGDARDADRWMKQGISRMKIDLGWGHAIYLESVAEYAKFLREQGETDRAEVVERELRMAQTVVDVHTLAPGGASLR